MKLNFTCGHCHQENDSYPSAKVVIRPDTTLLSPRCGRCGAPLYDMEAEVLPSGLFADLVAVLEHGLLGPHSSECKCLDANGDVCRPKRCDCWNSLARAALARAKEARS